MFTKYVGLRTIKTGMAVCLCIVVIAAIRLDSPFYAAIATIISMDKTIYGSLKTGENRMIGTLVGAVIGFVCALIMPGNAFICGLGIIILIVVCNAIKVKGSIVVGGIVLIAIMVNLKGQSAIVYSISRIIETFIGIAVAIIVNFLFFPYDGLGHIEKEFNNIVKGIILYSDACMKKEKDNDYDYVKLYTQIMGLETEIHTYKLDFHAKKKVSRVAALSEKIVCAKAIYLHLEIIKTLLGNYAISDNNLKRINSSDLIRYPIKQINITGEDIEQSIIYNYHLEALLNQYQCMCVNQHADKDN